MKSHRLFIGLFIALMLPFSGYSQSRKSYTNPDFKTLAKHEKVLAIIPFRVTLKQRPEEKSKSDSTTHSQKAIDDGYTAQEAMQTFLLDRSYAKKGYSVTFQDVGTTNGLLEKNNISIADLSTTDPIKLCKMLGVDGVIVGTLINSHPMSTGAAVAVDYLVGFGGKTNAGKCTITIYDGTTGKLMWKHEQSLSQGIGSNINTIIYDVMERATRRFPYEN